MFVLVVVVVLLRQLNQLSSGHEQGDNACDKHVVSSDVDYSVALSSGTDRILNNNKAERHSKVISTHTRRFFNRPFSSVQ